VSKGDIQQVKLKMTTDINNNPIVNSLIAGDTKTHVNNSHLENPPEDSNYHEAKAQSANEKVTEKIIPTTPLPYSQIAATNSDSVKQKNSAKQSQQAQSNFSSSSAMTSLPPVLPSLVPPEKSNETLATNILCPTSSTMPVTVYDPKAIIDTRISARFLIPAKAAGAIIGRGGSNIKQLRENYKAQIAIPDAAAPERIVRISISSIEKMKEVIVKMMELLKDDILKFKRLKSPNVDPTFTELRLLVHSSQAGAIIGPKGGHVKQINEETKAKINVQTEMCPYSSDKIAQITGTSESIADAVGKILELFQQFPPKGNQYFYDPVNFDPSYEYGGYGFTGYTPIPPYFPQLAHVDTSRKNAQSEGQSQFTQDLSTPNSIPNTTSTHNTTHTNDMNQQPNFLPQVYNHLAFQHLHALQMNQNFLPQNLIQPFTSMKIDEAPASIEKKEGDNNASNPTTTAVPASNVIVPQFPVQQVFWPYNTPMPFVNFMQGTPGFNFRPPTLNTSVTQPVSTALNSQAKPFVQKTTSTVETEKKDN